MTEEIVYVQPTPHPEKFYVNAQGVYLGAWMGGQPPVGAVEVASAPTIATQIWNAQNGTWGVADLRPSMPSLSARRFRLGLINGNIMPSQVQAIIEAMPAGPAREKALVEWEYASDFDRLHPLVLTVGTAMGLTPEQIDTMWMASQNL